MPFGSESIKQQQNAAAQSGYGNNGFGMGGSFGPGQSSNFGPGRTGGFTNAHMASSAANLRMGPGEVHGHYETTNQRNFKDYQIKHRPQTCKPKAEAVRTMGNSKHFQTSHKKEFKRRNYKPPAVDMIPYP
jgi:hypothetical protein